MFGFTGNTTDNKPFQLFKWKNFVDNEMILRILPNFFSDNKIYTRTYLHQINNRFYIHDENCKLCEILNSDDKYSEIQNKILRLKLLENKKEKWNHIITNHVTIGIFAYVKGYKKIQLIRFYDDMANEFLNYLISKDIKDNIVDLYNGNTIKIVFKRNTYFPYLNIVNIIVGQQKPVLNDKEKIKELDNLLHNEAFKYNKKPLTLEEAESVINEWYNNATEFYNTHFRDTIKEVNFFDNDIGNDEMISDESINDNNLDDSFDFDKQSNEIIEDDEIPF